MIPMNPTARDAFGQILERKAIDGNVSDVAKAARDALRNGPPFKLVVAILRGQGWSITGSAGSFTIEPSVVRSDAKEARCH